MRLPDELVRVADEQLGLLSRRQLLAAGVTRGELRWAIGRTARIVLPGVLALFTGPVSPRQRLFAAALCAGPVKGSALVRSAVHEAGAGAWSVVEADTLLGSFGIPVIAVTPRAFARDPRAFVCRVERAYRELVRVGRRADVQMRPRPWSAPGRVRAAWVQA
jgi:hypothetical protein